MTSRHVARTVGAAALAVGALLSAPFGVPFASAQPCPDVEVVFARATTESPGVGKVGQVFVDDLGDQVDDRSVQTYAVNYPASYDYAPSASAGGVDARAHVEATAANCPDTRIVLGGYSQGALVVDLLTAFPVSFGGFVPAPLPPEAADNVAAVVVFGNPATRFVRAPLTAVSPQFGSRTIDLCNAGDPICTPQGGNVAPSNDELFSPAHLGYIDSGLVNQGASFAASRL